MIAGDGQVAVHGRQAREQDVLQAGAHGVGFGEGDAADVGELGEIHGDGVRVVVLEGAADALQGVRRHAVPVLCGEGACDLLDAVEGDAVVWNEVSERNAPGECRTGGGEAISFPLTADGFCAFDGAFCESLVLLSGQHWNSEYTSGILGRNNGCKGRNKSQANHPQCHFPCDILEVFAVELRMRET